MNYDKNSLLLKNKTHYVWPRITEEVEQAIRKQLHDNVSIYNRSGILAEFEDKFAKYHGRSLALLSNSGTNAIFSMFEGINLLPEDEVICPAYTFFATASPLLYTGATPIFADCDMTGNITAETIKSKITNKTKAVIVTHMWGMPCDMDDIVSLCKAHNIYLLEDCSHAHGASYKGKKVGTFGDAAAWSLQGQKIITGGEGGIMLTDNRDILSRATLQGHYNKRCFQEIPTTHPLAKFSLTGFGLKFRAHPLAIAMANSQFDHLDEWISQKQEYTNLFIKTLGKYPFLIMPLFEEKQPSWYAFVMQFDENKSNGVSIESFYAMAHDLGLKELDRPKSTSPIYNLPLFTFPNEAMPRLYEKALPVTANFPNADKFYRQAIKLPMWAFPDEFSMVELYIKELKHLCDLVWEKPDVFKEGR